MPNELKRRPHRTSVSSEALPRERKSIDILSSKRIASLSPASGYMSALMESTADVIWSVDLDLRLLAFNRAAKQTFSASFGTIPVGGMRPEHLFPYGLAANWSSLYNFALSQGPLRTEYSFAAGRILELVLNPIVMNKKVTGVSVFGRDITERRTTERALLETKRKYREIIDGAKEGMFEITLDGQPLFVNLALARMLGYATPEELRTAMQDSAECLWADAITRDTFMSMLNEHGSVHRFECQFQRKDASVLWVSLSCRRRFAADGKTLIHEGFLEDITELKQAEAAAGNSEAHFQTLFQTSLDAISISRLSDGRIFDANEAFLDLTGFSREEVIGGSSTDLGIWANPHEPQKILDELCENSSCRELEVKVRKRNGRISSALVSVSMIVVEGNPHLLSVFRDVSEIKQATAMIRSLAFHDPLTQPPNRRLLMERLLGARAATGKNRALLFLDLDHFKFTNDSIGHAAGDLMLKEIGRRLAESSRGAGTVARIGGDEFILLLENLDGRPEYAAGQANSLAENIVKKSSGSFQLPGNESPVSFSVGIAVFGDELKSPETAIRQAEIAMLKAKEQGRGTIRFFSPELQTAVNARARMEQDLRQAIKANQLTLYYQPQVQNGLLIGAEALVRWNHPQHGFLPPGEFIPLAEETGLIVSLGDWVLQSACTQIAAWERDKCVRDIPVAVNISSKELREPDFVGRVLACIESTGVNPASLKLELTESSVAGDIEEVIVKMTALKAHGVQFSLEDFGTGYSSLAGLKRLPLDQLKIDRSFVQGILDDAASSATAQAILFMGNNMNLSVIAEGVEAPEHRDTLTTLGCQSFQGYLFSPPLPAEEFESMWMDRV